MAWRVEHRDGIWLPQIGWWLDARQAQARSFVSHAHFDHVAAHGEVLCSPGTSRLLRARLPGRRVEHLLPFGQTEPLTVDTAVTLHPAGHIHGSAQCLLAHAEHGTLLYTGDFKLRPGCSAEPCATPRADLLIMETTFGRPHYRFPPTEAVLADIVAFCHGCLDDGETPVLFGYSLGKSQELLCGLAAARLPVMLHPETLRLTRIYEELGVSVPPYREFDVETVGGHVVICPPQSGSSAFLRRLGARRTAVITGWALDPGAVYRYQCDAAFPLSDHADYPDLLRFVEAVQPRCVLTLHGFAQEFARTLRERGIEAWALGEDNQLELRLPPPTSPAPTPGTPPPLPAPAPAAPPAAPAAATADSLAGFATLAEQIRASPRKLAKIELLAGYLARLPPDAAPLAALYFIARPFPPPEGREPGLGWALARRAVLEAAGWSESAYRAGTSRFADAGDAAEALLAARRGTPTGPGTGAPLTLPQLAGEFEALAAARGPAAKLERFRALLDRLSPREAKYVVKILTGDLRIGLKEGLVEEAVARAWERPLEDVRTANLLTGDLAAVTRAARAGTLREVRLRVFHPLQFMLASPAPDAAALLARLPPPVWLEEKFDGIRCQVHHCDGRVELYSRELKRLTGQFPDLAGAVRELPDDFIADGELLAWRDGRALPFADLQRRLGRKGDDFFLGEAIPVSLTLYDLLWLDGQSLLAQPLAARRRRLERLLAGVATPALQLAPVREARTVQEIDAAFLAARQRGNEGLMAKHPESPYTPGRRGLAWLKLKRAFATLDVVVVAAEYGHGRRRDVLSDYTFAIRDEAGDRLLTIGKAYSGLTDAEIAALTVHFLANTLEVRGRRHRVLPDTVLEIAFDSIHPSGRHESGLALRFPRIVRLRPDKTPADIDTLETCRRLADGPGGA